MTHIVFFEKPGCSGNALQRSALEAAGHTVERRAWVGLGTNPALAPTLEGCASRTERCTT